MYPYFWPMMGQQQSERRGSSGYKEARKLLKFMEMYEEEKKKKADSDKKKDGDKKKDDLKPIAVGSLVQTTLTLCFIGPLVGIIYFNLMAYGFLHAVEMLKPFIK